jgi:tetratricopeptide (TPR) repeat protein
VATIASLLFICGAAEVLAAEKKASAKVPAQKAAPQRDQAISDANIQSSLKKAQDSLKAKDMEGALKLFLKIYDYSKDVLPAVKMIQSKYEKNGASSTLSMSEREEIVIRQKRVNQLASKYQNIQEATTYSLGYIYLKKGDGEKAKKFLLEAMETSPFSMKPDSVWARSKALLSELYNLEGEF